MACSYKDGSSIYLYDPSILNNINLSKYKNLFGCELTIRNPGENLKIRPLAINDYDKGFIELLKQLTDTGNISKEQFVQRFSEMKQSGGYFITVIEDVKLNRIVASASLVVEMKFIHSCALRGKLEDVVVDNTYRGKQLGKLIVVIVTLLSQQLKCYKMSLECKDKLIGFYKSIGYQLEPGNSNTMCIRHSQKINSQL